MPSDQNKLSFVDQLHNFVRTKTQDAYQNFAKGIPGHISKILANDFVEFTIDAIGPYTFPKIQIPQAFSKYHREPTQVGDKGVAVPSDYFIGGESGNDGSTANLYPRGNLTPLTFHPISNKNWPTKDPNMFLVTGGPSGHTIQSADGTTTKVIDNNNNIIDTSANILSHAAKAIQQIAQNSLTHALTSSNGIFNLVAHQFTVGAPGSSVADASSPPTPPQPTQQTIFNVIGSIIASGGMAIGSASGGNMGSGSINAEDIYVNGQPINQLQSVIILAANAVNLPDGTAIVIATMTLPAGQWSIGGEVWINVTSGSPSIQQIAAAITQNISTIGNNPDITSAINVQEPNQSRAAGTQVGFVLPLSGLYVDLSASTTYYLAVKATWTGTGALSGYGKIAGRYFPT